MGRAAFLEAGVGEDYQERVVSTPNTHPDYDALPEPIKAQVSEKEYCWLSERQRIELVQEMTMPEPTDD